jgi:hypothetical protein
MVLGELEAHGQRQGKLPAHLRRYKAISEGVLAMCKSLLCCGTTMQSTKDGTTRATVQHGKPLTARRQSVSLHPLSQGIRQRRGRHSWKRLPTGRLLQRFLWLGAGEGCSQVTLSKQLIKGQTDR